PGWRYKLIVWMLRLTPDALIRRWSIQTAQRYKRPKSTG
ncbi:MAG: hypothetical protein JWO19_5582, partial [Bryobacterales bacterium]|nr:hypothetical protein [Bryobacterales bacterium]